MRASFAIFILVLGCVPLFQNCGPASVELHNGTGPGYSEAELKTLRDGIEEMADLSCSTSSDCAALPIGAKACGGPTHYQIYSNASTDVQRLAQLVTDYTEMDRRRIFSENLAGDCSFNSPPQLECQQNECVAVVVDSRTFNAE